MEFKTCKICKFDLPKTKEYFPTTHKGKYFNSECRKCNNKRTKEWRENNLDRHKEHVKKWNKNNPGKKKEIDKNWRYSKQGVYGIFSGTKCLYVGESCQLLNRISKHKTHIIHPEHKTNQLELYNNLRQYSNLKFKILEETEDHVIRELHWINKLDPLYNERKILSN